MFGLFGEEGGGTTVLNVCIRVGELRTIGENGFAVKNDPSRPADIFEMTRFIIH